MKADIKFLSGLDHSNSIEILLGNVYKGDKGKSAYEIAVDNGFEGSEEEWLASLHVTTDAELNGESDNAIANKAVTAAVSALNANTGIDEYEEFSDQKEYKAGTTVKKDGLLYTFITDHAAGAWDESQVEETSLKRDFDKKVTELNEKLDENIIYTNIFSLAENITGLLSNDGSKLNAPDYWRLFYKVPVKKGNIFVYEKGATSLINSGKSYYIVTNNSGDVLLRRDYSSEDTLDSIKERYVLPEDGYISVSYANGDYVVCLSDNSDIYNLSNINFDKIIPPNFGILVNSDYLFNVNTEEGTLTIDQTENRIILCHKGSIIYLTKDSGNKKISLSGTRGGFRLIYYDTNIKNFIDISYDSISSIDSSSAVLLAIYLDNSAGYVPFNTANIIVNGKKYAQTYLVDEPSIDSKLKLFSKTGVLSSVDTLININTEEGTITIGDLNNKFIFYSLCRIIYLSSNSGNKEINISEQRKGVHYIVYCISRGELLEFSYSNSSNYANSDDYLLLVIYEDADNGKVLFNTANVFLNGTEYKVTNGDINNEIIKINEKLNEISSNSGIAESNSRHLAGLANYQRPIKDINHFIIYGQSLSTGQQTCPELSRENYKGNLMVGQYEWIYGTGFNTRDKLSPLKAVSTVGEGYIPSSSADQTNGETPNINFANAAKRLIDDYTLEIVDRKILATSSGVGGKSIELLSKGCPNNSGEVYNNFINTLSTVKRLVSESNKTLCCSAIIWMQGEYNASAEPNQGWNQDEPATNNKDDYKVYLLGGTTSTEVSVNGIVNDMISDVLEQYEQEYNPIVLCSQIGPSFNKTFDIPIDMALLEANNESEKITLVAPSYCVTDRWAHLDANGSRWLGEYYAKVWYKKVILGENWGPLQPNKINKSSRSITITFDVPEPPIVFDDYTVRPIENYGFSVKNNGVKVNIEDISITGGNKVLINVSNDLNGDVEIAYASVGQGWGNLRDSDKWISFSKYKDLDKIVENPEGISYHPYFEPKDKEGNIIYDKLYPNYNWCLKFYYKIPSDMNEISINTGL